MVMATSQLDQMPYIWQVWGKRERGLKLGEWCRGHLGEDGRQTR